MAKSRLEKIESIKTEIQQLENQRKRLLQAEKEQERKDRTKRLCKRAGLLESLIPDSITLTDEQFKTFLEKTIITEHSRRILDGLTARDVSIPASNSTNTARKNGENEDADERNGEAGTP
jgi:hypothetical protein